MSVGAVVNHLTYCDSRNLVTRYGERVGKSTPIPVTDNLVGAHDSIRDIECLENEATGTDIQSQYRDVTDRPRKSHVNRHRTAGIRLECMSSRHPHPGAHSDGGCV